MKETSKEVYDIKSEKHLDAPPEVDFVSPCFHRDVVVSDSLARIGCFRLLNHEIPSQLVWCNEEELKLKMKGIWPIGYANFRMVAMKMMHVILKKKSAEFESGNEKGNVCCIYKHGGDNTKDALGNSLKYDVIRMLIRGTDYSHSSCFHLCNGSSQFHFYSKKSWLSFCPEPGALIVTAGDQIQILSDGLYKSVIGRPIFKAEKKQSISMAFLCSHQNKKNFGSHGSRSVSLSQQAILALIPPLVYHVQQKFFMADAIFRGTRVTFNIAYMTVFNIETNPVHALVAFIFFVLLGFLQIRYTQNPNPFHLHPKTIWLSIATFLLYCMTFLGTLNFGIRVHHLRTLMQAFASLSLISLLVLLLPDTWESLVQILSVGSLYIYCNAAYASILDYY
ncbi:hypothetical protein V8G54_010475 [Vigna mungo]|uniref:Isopenicillin N synthase-like Fe(2+) 2OG dioxygenase domain-containing protein n=1 Tax=Vigna mungo TaxID=3915 RepID=A0AAQ3S5T8_VIGMU